MSLLSDLERDLGDAVVLAHRVLSEDGCVDALHVSQVDQGAKVFSRLPHGLLIYPNYLFKLSWPGLVLHKHLSGEIEGRGGDS